MALPVRLPKPDNEAGLNVTPGPPGGLVLGHRGSLDGRGGGIVDFRGGLSRRCDGDPSRNSGVGNL